MKIFTRNALVFCLFILSFSIVEAKNIPELKSDSTYTSHTYLTVRYHYGIILPNHEEMYYFLNDFTRGVELTYGISSFGKKNWTQWFNYPEVGVGFLYTSLGNDEIYGKGYALYPYINYHLARTSRFTSAFKLGVGLGYTPKNFSHDDNTFNHVISTNFNAYITFGLNLDYRVLPHFSLTANGDISHFSNGAIKKPNYGANIASYSGGVKYHFNSALTPKQKKWIPEAEKKHAIYLSANYGRSQASAIYVERENAYSAQVAYMYQSNAKNSFGIGLDGYYFGSAPLVHSLEQDPSTITESQKYFAGIYLQYQLNMGKGAIFMNVARYIYRGTPTEDNFYPRLGYRYFVAKNFWASFGLKASFFKSEFIELGVGYRI